MLLLSSSVYLLIKLRQSELHLPHFSSDAVNPISLEWNSINIDTKFQEGETDLCMNLVNAHASNRRLVTYTSVLAVEDGDDFLSKYAF